MIIPPLSSKYGPIKQVAYVVPDLDKAIESWHKQFGIGPFVVARNASPLANAKYRGQPSGKIVLDLAFAYIGDVQLELIEQVNDTPSMYKEAVARGYHSLHHYGVCVEDFPGVYRDAMANGFTAVVDAGFDGIARMSYVESEEIPGLILEIIEWNSLTKPYFESIKQLVDDADPAQLIHEFDLAKLTPIGPALKQVGKFLVNKLLGRVEKTAA